MYEPLFRLDSEVVIAARALFERNQERAGARACGKVFDWFYVRFSNPTRSILSISKEAGITSSSGQRLYVNHFMVLCGNVSPEERQRRIDEARREARNAHIIAKQLPALPLIVEVLESARSCGLEAQPRLMTKHNGHSKTRIGLRFVDVAEVACRLHFVTKLYSRKGDEALSVVELSEATLTSAAMHAVVVAIPGFKRYVLVMATDELPPLRGNGVGRRATHVRLRFYDEKPWRGRRKAAFNPWNHKHAWHRALERVRSGE